MKTLLIKFIRSLPIGAARQETLLFFMKLRYWPNFESPQTFNEKINRRKLSPPSRLMVRCIDKITVRDYVAEKIGAGHLIDLLYTGESITADQLHALGDRIVAKPNHDSKSTEVIIENSPEVAAAAAARLQAKVLTDFGKQTNQFAYSEVPPRILVERMLIAEDKVTPDDYKIFCFRQPDGSTRMHIELHENREQPDYFVSSFDGDLEPIALRAKEYGTRPFPRPELWPRMREIALSLSADFDHVRIDLYCIGERIFFGEMTFFDGGGRTDYSRVGGERNDLDREMGAAWSFEDAVDPNTGRVRTPAAPKGSPQKLHPSRLRRSETN